MPRLNEARCGCQAARIDQLSTSLRERLSRDRRASRGAWSFLTRSHRSSVRSRRPVWPSSSYRHQHMTQYLLTVETSLQSSYEALPEIVHRADQLIGHGLIQADHYQLLDLRRIGSITETIGQIKKNLNGDHEAAIV
ncbi:hypothetical protein EYF80_004218 [Liparis tanakae]|uniref:Uncharacterized protein n=1 Tax=Liparis tanakae TaxID=230148 RepID=A0A4Z2J5B8_9TELE|nr:hypothetical protein EYF80_004218 [Liparis tanakae]